MSTAFTESKQLPDATKTALRCAPSAGRSNWLSKKVNAYVGIDIGENEVRVATLQSRNSADETLGWTGRHRFPLPTSADQEMTPHWLQAVIDATADRLPRCIDTEINVAAMAMPIAWTHYQTVVGHEIPETRQQCSAMFSESIFQSPAHLCHWPVVGVHHGTPSADDQYVVAATAERAVCQLADRVTASGYRIHSVLPHGVVLAHGAQQLTGVDAQCVLWLSHTSALVTVRHKSGVGLSRTLPSVPQQILKLEQSDRPLDAHALRPYLSTIAAEFSATAQYAARADMSRPSKRPILIAGPLAELHGVDEIIATLTETPVAVWSFAGKVRPASRSQFIGADSEFVRRLDARYAGALSLALAATRTNSRGYVR